MIDALSSPLQVKVFVNSLNLQSTSTLDLKNSGMIITNGTYADVFGRIASAFNQGWGGTGITSSVVKSDEMYCLGVLTGAEYVNELGQSYFLDITEPVSSNWILVRPTVFGDSTFDGIIDGADYAFLDCGYQGSAPTNHWIYGDYSYDGIIDGTDYAFIDNVYLNSGQYPW